MKSITINGSKRESVGKKSTKALRNAGQVPCVLYGGDTPVHFAADEVAFNKLVYTPNAHTVVIELDNGETYQGVMQDIQFHPVTDAILHIDFYELHEGKPITMEVPVHFVGNSKGVKAGGVLRKNSRRLRVKALPKNLPDFIEVDITPLKIGNKLYVGDLQHELYRIMQTDNTVVCQIKRARLAMAIAVDDEDEDELEEGAEAAAEGDAPAEGDAQE
ncbi:50S ribosomal protein L25/general stress protein Ctc [Mangrovimonas spongiae]|uniref:Large ribosomal subunit protein bL25 n=1 Tax=Mangrovimonas spongiae TaxID=2494697 RepID=A0A3R9NQZ9_9FLAO|nr:50S ribosomal protein L25/general stress protein Ctc [Mangrovimonas spongiae]RSK39698.1 50S ribosomal protein L25/general stress protein Ctc [Mangrovimonas spongiae]